MNFFKRHGDYERNEFKVQAGAATKMDCFNFSLTEAILHVIVEGLRRNEIPSFLFVSVDTSFYFGVWLQIAVRKVAFENWVAISKSKMVTRLAPYINGPPLSFEETMLSSCFYCLKV